MHRIEASHRVSAALLGAALLLGSGFLFAAAARAAEPALLSLPQAPAWQHGRAFVAAFNSGDRETIARYLQQRLSERALATEALGVRVDELVRQRRELGPLEPVEASGVAHVLVLNLEAEQGDADLIVLVADDAAHLDEVRLVREAAPLSVAGDAGSRP